MSSRNKQLQPKMSSRPGPTRLDIIDKVTLKISTLNDEALKSKIQQEIPVVIAVGDQSSGKSSIMGRILGHALPSKAGICTRVPVIIQTRREKRDPSVTLKGKSTNHSSASAESGRYYIENYLSLVYALCNLL